MYTQAATEDTLTDITLPDLEPDVRNDGTPDLNAARTWQDAVCVLIDQYCARGWCFSSGELARVIRLQRDDLRFGVVELGEFVKDLFYSAAIEYTDLAGGSTPACQIPRRTVGSSRTPVDTEVFVYGPTPAHGLAHSFEVEIPRPGFVPTPSERRRMAAARPSRELVATVHGDGRLCVPRRAFEVLSHRNGRSLRGGDRVWVEARLDELRLYLEPRDGCSEHDLSRERGRVRFVAPVGLPCFAPGARYAIEIEDEGLRIELAAR